MKFPPVAVPKRSFALLLVLFTAAVAAVLAYAFIAGQSTMQATAGNAVNTAAARAIAESGLRLAMAHVVRDSDWRSSHTSGSWIAEPGVALGGGTFILRGDDGRDANSDAVISTPSEGDANLSDDPMDLLTLTATGRIGGAVGVIRAVVTPKPLDTLRVLMLVSSTTTLSSEDVARKTLMEGWGWTVTTISSSASTSTFTAALAETDVVYVPRLVTSASAAGTWDFEKGLVSESGALASAIGFSSTYSSFSSTTANITNNTHEITQGLATGSVTLSTASGTGSSLSGTFASGGTILASLSSKPQVMALDKGQVRYGTATSGLVVSYFSLGSAPAQLSDINWTSTPTQTISLTQVNVPAASYGENFGARFVGGLVVATAGTWTFTTTSDDGSGLWIDGTQVVSNDGVHSMQSRSGSVSLTAGTHAFEARAFERSGDFGIIAYWRGPGVSSDTIIPASAFVQGASPARRVHLATGGIAATALSDDGKKLFRQAFEWAGGPITTNGILAEYFQLASSPSTLADINFDSTPTATAEVENINIPDHGGAGWSGGPTDNFGVRYSGFVEIPTAGSWTFELRSDDGSVMTLDGTTLIDNDGLHSMTTVSGTRTLTAGRHAFEVRAFERGGEFGAILSWRGPGVSSTTVVPASALSGGRSGGYSYSVAYLP
jgi:hypothetical protein